MQVIAKDLDSGPNGQIKYALANDLNGFRIDQQTGVITANRLKFDQHLLQKVSEHFENRATNVYSHIGICFVGYRRFVGNCYGPRDPGSFYDRRGSREHTQHHAFENCEVCTKRI